MNLILHGCCNEWSDPVAYYARINITSKLIQQIKNMQKIVSKWKAKIYCAPEFSINDTFDAIGQSEVLDSLSDSLSSMDECNYVLCDNVTPAEFVDEDHNIGLVRLNVDLYCFWWTGYIEDITFTTDTVPISLLDGALFQDLLNET